MGRIKRGPLEGRNGPGGRHKRGKESLLKAHSNIVALELSNETDSHRSRAFLSDVYAVEGLLLSGIDVAVAGRKQTRYDRR